MSSSSSAPAATGNGGVGRKRKLAGTEGEMAEAEAPPAKVLAKDKEEAAAPEPSASAAAAVGGEGDGSPKGAGFPRESERTKELLQRIQEVEEEKRQIEGGTHPEYTKKSDALERVRDRRVFAAERFKQMQMDNIQGLYEYEVLEAEASYKAAMEELKARLLDTMEQRVKRLEEDRERVLKQLERVGQATRVLRSKNPFKSEEHPELAQLAGSASSRLAGEEGAGVGGSNGSVSMFLSEAEIKDDLRAISTDLAKRARAYYDSTAERMVDASVEDGCLHYGEHCLLKGEAVVFTSMLSGEDFFGRIASIRPSEILVKLSDGTKARIHLAYLKNGRIKLKVQDDGADD